MFNEIIVLDEEVWRPFDPSCVHRWAEDVVAIAVARGMPSRARYYGNRNEDNTATIFEWE
jgi:hypothetical protein